jgi:uncharacterized membrane protein
MTESVLKALHVLGAVLWVGGMAFALLVLRPSLSVLEPPQRLALHGQVFARFFKIIWHGMPVILLTGYAMVFGIYGGFGSVNPAVHTMHLLGLIMSAVFVFIFFSPWPAFRAALDAGDHPGAAAAADRIRKLIMLNLALGLITVAIAPFGP